MKRRGLRRVRERDSLRAAFFRHSIPNLLRNTFEPSLFLVSLFVSVFVFSLGVDQRTCELASESSRLHGCSKHQGLHELVLAVSERFASAREKISVSSAVFFVFLDFTPRLPFETFFSSPISRTCFRLPFFFVKTAAFAV